MKNIQLTLLTAICVATAFTFFACGGSGKKSAPKEASKPSHGTFTDSRDGKTYKWVKIGCQTWMAENLKYAASDSKCYNGESDNCDKYGRLYNWATAKTVCPSGWHLPGTEVAGSEEVPSFEGDWFVLMNFVQTDNGETFPPSNDFIAGKYLKATSGWKDDEGQSGNGEDKYGFAALPGGEGNDDGDFDYVGEKGIWWSANDEPDDNRAHFIGMRGRYEDMALHASSKEDHYSIRCVKDDSNEAEKKACLDKNAAEVLARIAQAIAQANADGSSFTDARDGKTYKVVKIGEQAWMAENLNYAASGSKCYDDISDYCKQYGKLYDWATAMQACPSGWHLPTRAEWDILAQATGDKETAGKKLKSKKGWSASQNDNGNGTDDFKFSALPGISGDYGSHGAWWSATEHEKAGSAYVQVMCNEFDYIYEQGENKNNVRFSVRCIADANIKSEK